MARQRDYHTEYQRREERAIDRGFASYYDERKYIERHKSEISRVREQVLRRTERGGRSYDPAEAVAFALAFPERVSAASLGATRHFAVAYNIEYLGMSEDEAIEAMREEYGDSGEESSS